MGSLTREHSKCLDCAMLNLPASVFEPGPFVNVVLGNMCTLKFDLSALIKVTKRLCEGVNMRSLFRTYSMRCAVGYMTSLMVSMPNIYNLDTIYLTWKLIQVDAKALLDWMTEFGVPVSAAYVSFCLYVHKFHYVEEKHVRLLTCNWVTWIWNKCSDEAFQWCAERVPVSEISGDTFRMGKATLRKLDILGGLTLTLSSFKATEAAQDCRLEILTRVVDMCRTWYPMQCMITSIHNNVDKVNVRRYIQSVCVKSYKA